MMHVSPSIVRVAKSEDRLEIWRLFLQDWNENHIFELSPQKVDWLLTRLLQPEVIPPDDMGTRGIIGVIGPSDALEAVAGVVISSAWYSVDRCLNDLVVYVDPNYRNSGHAKALLEWVKFQSIITGLPLVSGVVTRERTEAKVRLYRRQMPEMIGASFYFDPKASVVTSSGTGLETSGQLLRQ